MQWLAQSPQQIKSWWGSQIADKKNYHAYLILAVKGGFGGWDESVKKGEICNLFSDSVEWSSKK